MAKSVNKVTLLGHLGRDPEFKVLRSGVNVANVSLATSERFKQGDEYKERTEWHHVTLYGRLAEVVRDYVKKGDRLYLEGRMRTDSWDENGTTRYRTYIIAEDLTLLGNSGHTKSKNHASPAQHNDSQITDDDIPF